MSPYTAFDNNPVYWADPSGADGETLTGAILGLNPFTAKIAQSAGFDTSGISISGSSGSSSSEEGNKAAKPGDIVRAGGDFKLAQHVDLDQKSKSQKIVTVLYSKIKFVTEGYNKVLLESTITRTDYFETIIDSNNELESETSTSTKTTELVNSLGKKIQLFHQ